MYPFAQGSSAVGTQAQYTIHFFLTIFPKGSPYYRPSICSANNKFEDLDTHDEKVECSGAPNLRATSFMKIANDICLLGFGPRCVLSARILLENEPGLFCDARKDPHKKGSHNDFCSSDG